MEYVTASNIMLHLEENHIITPVQHGFCRNQSSGKIQHRAARYDTNNYSCNASVTQIMDELQDINSNFVCFTRR